MRYTITRCWNTPAVTEAIRKLRLDGYNIRRRGRGPRKDRSEHQQLNLDKAPYFTAYIDEVERYSDYYDRCNDCYMPGELNTTCDYCGRGMVSRKRFYGSRVKGYTIDCRMTFVRLQKNGKLRLRLINKD